MNRTFDIKIISKPIDTNISGPHKSIDLCGPMRIGPDKISVASIPVSR
ncbi:hypothetical protein BP1258A_2359 [Burkholderia pseudomallei 1258a]|nr:hypothetical protein BP1258A_2359 [Burkholderia pseudomallei 1258a]EIF64317.1 hypothetical protein BP1258B_2532 [Burkholderia pseudomallei 1258b]EIF75523.1 hypothetical protein BP354E_2261 [Burkholderia pseudomallei 354e]EIF80206.1 hypothetical protein BP354A_2581 [Burkholderia pseudomallei 354a]